MSGRPAYSFYTFYYILSEKRFPDFERGLLGGAARKNLMKRRTQ
jgi:hypothetical protein